MSHAELIRRFDALPAAQQAQVFDFVEFLASRQAAQAQAADSPAEASRPRVPVWLDESFRVPAFTPLSREEANARP